MSVVRPTNDRIGPWQVRMARLAALARHSRAPDALVRCRAEALALRQEIAEESMALSRRCQDLAPAVSNSGRIADTARALQSVSHGLEATISLLEGEARQVN